MAITPLCKSVQCVNDSVAINLAAQTMLTATTVAHLYAVAHCKIGGNKVAVTIYYD